MPAKHTSGHHVRARPSAPRCTSVAVDPEPASAAATCSAEPRSSTPPTSSPTPAACSRPPARRRRTTPIAPGTSSTAPPPAAAAHDVDAGRRARGERRATSSALAPTRARAPAGRRRTPTPPARRRRRASRAWKSAAEPLTRSTTAERRHDAMARYGFHASGTRVDADDDPRRRPRRPARAQQAHAGLVGRAVALGQVARPARRGDVLPDVLAAARARHHVVDRVGGARRSTGSGSRRGRTRRAATARVRRWNGTLTM